MRRHTLTVLFAAFTTISVTGQCYAAELYGLSPGPVELQSAGPIAFGPSGVLFVGDAKAAQIYAINTEDTGDKSTASYDIKDLTAKLSQDFGGQEVSIADMAVNPETANLFLTVSAGDKVAIAKVTPDGTVTQLNLDKIGNAVAALPNPPEDKVVKQGRRSRNARAQSITDIAYVDGRVLVAGLSAADSPSTVREFDFPFRDKSNGMQVEIYHAAHGRSEDYAAIQTFVPFNIGGEPSLLAGYTCTPLVKLPIAKIKSNSKVQGTTVAELGNRNRPLDMIVYKKDGKDFVLMANSARGVMKIGTDQLQGETGLSERVSGGGTAGQSYQTIDSLSDVVQLDKLDDSHAIVMVQPKGEPASIRTIDLP
jgi:hypothetical protein